MIHIVLGIDVVADLMLFDLTELLLILVVMVSAKRHKYLTILKIMTVNK